MTSSVPRPRRADLVAAFLGVNVGVLAVTIILANSTVSAGLGLGLFGVLSIIRLRSDQISQTEIAYYFASLALGLLTGMSSAVTPLLGGMIALILVALAPLAVRHRVHAEVDERVHLHPLPLKLTVGGPNIGQVVLVDHAYGFRLMVDASAGPAPCRFRIKDSLPISA